MTAYHTILVDTDGSDRSYRVIDHAAELARACPDTRFVLDHCGTPDIAGGGWDVWSAGLREVAALPNVHVKLSEFGLRDGPWIEADNARIAAGARGAGRQ